MTKLPNALIIPMTILPDRPSAAIPRQSTPGSAGYDLTAALAGPLTVEAGSRVAVPTGIVMAIPHGFEGQVRPRSGLALHHGITVLNTPGTIDSDYRGEVTVILINHGNQPFVVEPGMRIAQLVIAACQAVIWQPVSVLPATERNSGGFGHTGLGKMTAERES